MKKEALKEKMAETLKEKHIFHDTQERIARNLPPQHENLPEPLKEKSRKLVMFERKRKRDSVPTEETTTEPAKKQQAAESSTTLSDQEREIWSKIEEMGLEGDENKARAFNE